MIFSAGFEKNKRKEQAMNVIIITNKIRNLISLRNSLFVKRRLISIIIRTAKNSTIRSKIPIEMLLLNETLCF